MDFAVLLTNLSHVLGPIAHDEFDKLLDLDHEYPVYHVALNELIYTILHTVLRGLALSLYEESARVHPYDGRCALQRIRFQVEGIVDLDSKRSWLRLRKTIVDETVDPTTQLSVFRTLTDRHARLHPAYADSDRVEDLWHVLSDSAAVFPHLSSLYLVVLRELRDNRRFTFSSLCNRICKA
ncbi:hypothetical protein CYMTET_46547 [Cymbomonas tetramitiformis]|uniref:Uncharacterized protein n=1 Tax=Cymbomonas tetramitiformis TaxID=36881 RepID=A0AAE0BXY6_9CHLO|nr:hypothetical protein CYMTET_46547 [Cymbomonas tetramitiformis]